MLASVLPELWICVIISLMARESATVSKGSTASFREGIVLLICSMIPSSSSSRFAFSTESISTPSSLLTTDKNTCSTVRYSCLFSLAYPTAFLNTSFNAILIIYLSFTNLLQSSQVMEIHFVLLSALLAVLWFGLSRSCTLHRWLCLFHVSAA